jgi:uncharacterized protein YndB with AHSA1/START domain
MVRAPATSESAESDGEPLVHVEVSALIDAPADRVWARYTDYVSWTRWAGLGTVRLDRPGSPDRNGVGAVRVIENPGLTVWEEVLSFEPPRRLTYHVLHGGLPMKDQLGEVVLEPVGQQTRILWRSRFRSRLYGMGPAYRTLVTYLFRRALDGLAEDLKQR